MKKIFLFLFFISIPINTYAQLSQIKTVNNLATRLMGIGNIITYSLVSLAVIYIIWNTVHYFIRPNDGDSRKTAGQDIMWGIIGLFIIVSLWGLVNILVNTFNTDPNIPKNRFPTVDFVNKNNLSNPSNSDFTSQPDFDIRDVPAGSSDNSNGGNVLNNWNTNLNPNSSDNTQNYFR